MPRLDFFADHKLFVKVRLTDEEVLLGRCDDCTVQLPHHKVSRYHAVVRPSEEGYWIVDSSRHGTRVNDSFIEDPHLLQAGDRIAIEQYLIVYRAEEGVDASGSADTTDFDN